MPIINITDKDVDLLKAVLEVMKAEARGERTAPPWPLTKTDAAVDQVGGGGHQSGYED